ncbi:MAG: phospholipase [Prevotellaceae bacterium]|jgi:hypothetical protein|nr:phospholipase [Prevotellaceae bacterium]
MFILILLLIVAVFLSAVVVALNRKNMSAEEPSVTDVDAGCCGAHAVCERETLLNNSSKIVYYDDEELDEMANTNPAFFTVEQIRLLEDVFYTLKESDVAGWLKSLQLRNILLPENIKEEALMIIRERRAVHL